MKGRTLRTILLTLPLTAAGAAYSHTSVTADAAPAPYEPKGSESFETVLLSRSPVTVEKETLTFRISELPDLKNGEMQNVENYTSCVTARYELFNPTAEPADVYLALPLGVAADYCKTYDKSGKINLTDVPSNYTFLSDGQEAACKLRYTYSGNYGFDFKEGLKNLKGQSGGFYSPELPVTQYTVSCPNTDSNGFIRLEFEFNLENTRIYVPSCYCCFTENGRSVVILKVREQAEAFYVIGDPVKYNAYAVKNGYREASGLTEIPEHYVETGDPTTLQEFLLSGKTIEEIDEADWFHIAVGYFERGDCSATDCGIVNCSLEALQMENLARWYEYSIEVPAGARIVHEITSPVYPTMRVDGGYYFTYGFAPAQKWQEYGELEIRIETPFCFGDSSLEFTKGESGTYTFARNSLPMGELKFRLSEFEPQNTPYRPYENATPALTTAFILFGAVAGVAAVTVTVTVIVDKKKKKRSTERLEMGKTTEGHIDDLEK